MDSSDTDIHFDEAGVCNHCRNYDLRKKNELLSSAERSKKLQAIREVIRRSGEGKKYDCIIGVSGGVDSTMVAFVVKKLGLRPLAVHVDNGWDAELAVHNIEKTLKKLDIDLYTWVIDWEEFRDLQISFFKSSVANIEALTDHAIMATLFKIASRENIKYLISGGNIVTEGIMPSSWMYDSRDLRHIKSIHRRFGRIPMKTFPHCSVLQYFYYIFVKRIKYVPILNLIHYNKNRAKKFIERELGWRDYGGKHYESIFTRFFQAHYLPRKFGIDKRRAHLSTLICSGQITREEALEEIAGPLYPDELFHADLDFFLKKMGFSSSEWEDILRAPVKNHRDYPSNHFLFRTNAWIIPFIKRMVKPL